MVLKAVDKYSNPILIVQIKMNNEQTFPWDSQLVKIKPIGK